MYNIYICITNIKSKENSFLAVTSYFFFLLSFWTGILDHRIMYRITFLYLICWNFYTLSALPQIQQKNIGLYGDDGLVVFKNTSRKN